MIHPAKTANRIDTTFSVCDIENRSNGNVLAIGFYDGREYVTFSNWEQWLAFIFASKHKEHKTVYAHNGSGWDWLSLLECICKDGLGYTFDTIQNGTRLVCVTLDNGKSKIRLLDSLFLLQSSLDKAGRIYAGRGKIETNHLPEWYWENDRETFWKYLNNDCTLLYDTMIGFCQTIYSKIAQIPRLGITLPSTSLKIFCTKYLNRSITLPDNEECKQALRMGYLGGRVEVFKQGYHKEVSVYDINSLYPSVMADTLVPASGTASRTKKPDIDGCGVFRIRFQQTRGIPLLLSRGLGVLDGEGWYYTNEIRRLLKVGKVEVLDGWQFKDTSVLFGSFVKDLYALRMTDKTGPLGNVCKLLMNSLYGKFGTKPERSKTCMLTFDMVEELVTNGIDVEPISQKYGIYKVTEEKPVHCEHVGIAGTITSEARARLWEFMDASTIYCDTDSVHTTKKIPVGNGLGEMKLEFEGEGVYVGKKLYALRNTKEEKIRAKGIRIGGKLGCDLDFSGLLDVAKGAKVVCKFQAAETVNGVMKGKQSCKMVQRTRTVRKTVGLILSRKKPLAKSQESTKK